jgi:hypothetical protein
MHQAGKQSVLMAGRYVVPLPTASPAPEEDVFEHE